MKIYAPPEALKAQEPQLPNLPIFPTTPTQYSQAEYGLQFWKAKLSERLSSPSQQPFNSWAHRTGTMLAYGELVTLQLNQLSTKDANQQNATSQSHHVLQKHGVLTGAA